MLDIRTPLSKDTRVSRLIDLGIFTSMPGVWAGIDNNGKAFNITPGGTVPPTCKLVISRASLNEYESNDVKVGRITTLETIGARFGVDSDGYYADPFNPVNPGDFLSVTAGSGVPTDPNYNTAGRLVKAQSGDRCVAVTEGYDAGMGILTFVTTSSWIFP